MPTPRIEHVGISYDSDSQEYNAERNIHWVNPLVDRYLAIMSKKAPPVAQALLFIVHYEILYVHYENKKGFNREVGTALGDQLRCDGRFRE